MAGLSKYHFLRLFRATYGLTPGEYVSQRRIERAQDLLRATGLSVTEVCFAVGFSSLGSFSSRFKTTSWGRRRRSSRPGMPTAGAPHIPGCYVFMWGLAERSTGTVPRQSAIAEKPPAEPHGS